MSTSKQKKDKKKQFPWILFPALAAVLLLCLILVLGRYAAGLSQESEPAAAGLEPNPYQASDFEYQDGFLACSVADARLGIDVSEHQTAVDWDQVRSAGVDYVMIRVGYRGYTEGKLFRDSCFEHHLAGAQAAGLDVGVYFFSQAITPEEAKAEADFLLSVLGRQPLEMGVAYDWEFVSTEARTGQTDGRTLTDCAIAFCEAIADKGYDPIVYFNQHQAENMYILDELTDYSFWLAMYSDQMTFPHRVDLWQYTEAGTVPGVPGEVDLNLYLP